MAINVKLLRKIEKYITEEPRRLNMVQWGAVFNAQDPAVEAKVCDFESHNYFKTSAKDLPPCGSVGCIAGTTWLLNQTPEQLEQYRERPNYGYSPENGGYQFYRLPTFDIPAYATEALGIDEEQADRLFYVPGMHDVDTGWPAKYAKRYIKAKTPKQRAKVTVERIEHFIKTKGAE